MPAANCPHPICILGTSDPAETPRTCSHDLAAEALERIVLRLVITHHNLDLQGGKQRDYKVAVRRLPLLLQLLC